MIKELLWKSFCRSGATTASLLVNPQSWEIYGKPHTSKIKLIRRQKFL